MCMQLNVFLAMSAALRQMAATQWPGFTSEGLWVITDLTQTSIVWGAWPKIFLGAFMPYSMAGFLLPFTCVLLYIKTVRESPLGELLFPPGFWGVGLVCTVGSWCSHV